MSIFKIDLNEVEKNNAWDVFNEVMAKIQDAQVEYEAKLAKELGVSEACAGCVNYLRSRGRWTKELESQLIEMDKAGLGMPNMCEWPE